MKHDELSGANANRVLYALRMLLKHPHLLAALPDNPTAGDSYEMDGERAMSECADASFVEYPASFFEDKKESYTVVRERLRTFLRYLEDFGLVQARTREGAVRRSMEPGPEYVWSLGDRTGMTATEAKEAVVALCDRAISDKRDAIVTAYVAHRDNPSHSVLGLTGIVKSGKAQYKRFQYKEALRLDDATDDATLVE